jgi:hypothetical protein
MEYLLIELITALMERERREGEEGAKEERKESIGEEKRWEEMKER